MCARQMKELMGLADAREGAEGRDGARRCQCGHWGGQQELLHREKEEKIAQQQSLQQQLQRLPLWRLNQ